MSMTEHLLKVCLVVRVSLGYLLRRIGTWWKAKQAAPDAGGTDGA